MIVVRNGRCWGHVLTWKTICLTYIICYQKWFVYFFCGLFCFILNLLQLSQLELWWYKVQRDGLWHLRKIPPFFLVFSLCNLLPHCSTLVPLILHSALPSSFRISSCWDPSQSRTPTTIASPAFTSSLQRVLTNIFFVTVYSKPGKESLKISSLPICRWGNQRQFSDMETETRLPVWMGSGKVLTMTKFFLIQVSEFLEVGHFE